MKRHRPVVRLNTPGDFVVGAFCGEPRGLDVHWFGERFRICKGKDCPYCAKRKRGFVVPHNFYLYGEGSIEIVELSTKFESLSDVRAEHRFEDWWFKVERTSCKTFTIEPFRKLTRQDKAKIRAAELNDLAVLYPESYDGQDDRQCRQSRCRNPTVR